MHDLAGKGADEACNEPEYGTGSAKQRTRVCGTRRCRSGKASAEKAGKGSSTPFRRPWRFEPTRRCKTMEKEGGGERTKATRNNMGRQSGQHEWSTEAKRATTGVPQAEDIGHTAESGACIRPNKGQRKYAYYGDRGEGPIDGSNEPTGR